VLYAGGLALFLVGAFPLLWMLSTSLKPSSEIFATPPTLVPFKSTLENFTRLFAETKAAFGRVDVLVNNAGVYEFAPLEAVSEAHFRKQFDLNVLGVLLASKEAAASFDGQGGSIVNVSSVVSALAPPNASVYSATKAAVDAITRSLAKELGARGIRVNAVNPGIVETEGVHAAGISGSDFEKQAVARTPLGRIGQPGDIAPAVAFLASDDARWVTGETLGVSGGVH